MVLIDAGQAGAGVTAPSFAWVRSAGTFSSATATLRAAATTEYRRVDAELLGLPVYWSGSLSWRSDDAPPRVEPGQEIVDGATAALLEPNLRSVPSELCGWPVTLASAPSE